MIPAIHSPQSICLIGILAAIVLLPGNLAAAQKNSVPAETSSRSLIEDGRLDRVIEFHEIGIPLEELLAKLSKGDPVLTCTPACAQLQLQINLRQRPLRALMQSLAQLLPGTWKPKEDKSGYTLVMSQKAVEKRDYWWKLFLSARDQAIMAQQAYLLQQLRQEPYRRKPTDPDPEGSDPVADAYVAEQKEFFHLLPAAVQEQIANQVTDCLLYTVGIGSFGEGGQQEEGSIAVAFNDLPVSLQDKILAQTAANLHQDVSKLDWNHAFLSVSNGGFALDASAILPGGSDTGSLFNAAYDIAPDAVPVLLDQTRLLQEVQRLGKAAPELWKRLAQFRQSRFWDNDLPSKNRMDHRTLSRADILEWLADKARIEFVSDYYSATGRPLSRSDKSRPLPGSLKEELDFQAVERDFSWKQRPDNIYLFRNNRWYMEDRLRAPLKLIRKWLADQHNIPQDQSISIAVRIRRQMDWQAEAVSNLSVWQIAVGLRWFSPRPVVSLSQPPVLQSQGLDFLIHSVFPFEEDVTRLLSGLTQARFYASLGASQRDDLIAGRLPFSALSAEQRGWVLTLLPRLRPLGFQAMSSVHLALQPVPKYNFTRQGGPVRLAVVEMEVQDGSPLSAR